LCRRVFSPAQQDTLILIFHQQINSYQRRVLYDLGEDFIGQQARTAAGVA
jgi:hypothetical protein